MKLVALEIPDDPALLLGWLEGHLVNRDLAALVAELEAVHGEQPDNFSLTDVLRDRRDAVLSRGLASLPAEGLKSLLRNPRLGAIPKMGDFDSTIRSLPATTCDKMVEDPRSAFNFSGKIHLLTTVSGESSVSEKLAPDALEN